MKKTDTKLSRAQTAQTYPPIIEMVRADSLFPHVHDMESTHAQLTRTQTAQTYPPIIQCALSARTCPVSLIPLVHTASRLCKVSHMSHLQTQNTRTWTAKTSQIEGYDTVRFASKSCRPFHTAMQVPPSTQSTHQNPRIERSTHSTLARGPQKTHRSGDTTLCGLRTSAEGKTKTSVAAWCG